MTLEDLTTAPTNGKVNGHHNGSTIQDKSTPIEQVEIRSPIRGRDILAVGKNYIDHAKEFNSSGYDSSDKVDIPTFRELI